MNKGQQELLDEVYENYLNEWTFEKYPNDGSVYNVDPIKVKEHTKPQFEYRCKTDSEFSEKWGLTIEERELSEIDRINWAIINRGVTPSAPPKELDRLQIPTKLITITYNDTKIESYE
jgi:hypothetical protein